MQAPLVTTRPDRSWRESATNGDHWMEHSRYGPARQERPNADFPLVRLPGALYGLGTMLAEKFVRTGGQNGVADR